MLLSNIAVLFGPTERKDVNISKIFPQDMNMFKVNNKIGSNVQIYSELMGNNNLRYSHWAVSHIPSKHLPFQSQQ